MDDKDIKRLISKVGVRGNVRYITISDNIPEHWDEIINIAKSNYAWYAYIFHDKDDTEKHLHILCYDKGGTNLKSHCKRFSSVIESNFVQKVFNPRAMARYLIHLDNPEKYQYDSDLVITNSKQKFLDFIQDEDLANCNDEFLDYIQVREGKMTPGEFVEKYQYQINKSPFHHRINLYRSLSNAYDFKMYNLRS